MSCPTDIEVVDAQTSVREICALNFWVRERYPRVNFFARKHYVCAESVLRHLRIKFVQAEIFCARESCLRANLICQRWICALVFLRGAYQRTKLVCAQALSPVRERCLREYFIAYAVKLSCAQTSACACVEFVCVKLIRANFISAQINSTYS